MFRSASFRVLTLGLIALVGVVVFAITQRDEVQQQETVSISQPVTAPQSAVAWPDRGTETELKNFLSPSAGITTVTDPVETARQADEFFEKRQYQEAADLYAALISSGFRNVNPYNNLGITLQYLGRSDEALNALEEGIAMDPTYQRIWLTLGFVNGQIGNFAEARTALSKAVEMDPGNEVGQSAASMLENLR